MKSKILLFVLFIYCNNSLYSQVNYIYEYRRISTYIDQINSQKDQFGAAVSNVGDINGDGIDELAIGSDGYDEGGSNKGAIWLVFFNRDKTIQKIQELSSISGNVKYISTDSWFGNGISGIGDLNHDGVLDIAVGAGYDSDTGYQEGAIHILFMNSDGTVKESVKIVEGKYGFNASLRQLASIGGDVSAIPDMDGDGNMEILIGGNRESTDWNGKSGAVYIMFMNSDGTVKKYRKIGDKASGFTFPLTYESYFGMCVKYIGDLDGDGLPEIAVGAHRMNNIGSIHLGKVFIISLNNDGSVKKYNVITPDLFNIDRNDESVLFGVSVDGIGDFDSDGIEDMTIGAAGVDQNGYNSGITYICYMNSNGTIREFEPLLINRECFGMDISPESIFSIDSDFIQFPDDENPHFFIGALREYKNSVQTGEVFEVEYGKMPSTTVTAETSTLTCGDNEIQLNAIVEGGDYDVFWKQLYGNNADLNNPIQKNTTATNLMGTNYTFTASLQLCPQISDTVSIVKHDLQEDFEIQNVITSNNDGYNDYFVLPQTFDELKVELLVVNRLGLRQYYSKDYKSNWFPKTPGTYYYYMKISDCNITYKGIFQNLK